jgi:TfoX/Sxy family transcriptional regulator of competence genes
VNDRASEVFEALATEHLSRPAAGRRGMFGRDCLTVNGHNIAFFHDDRLALKLAPSVAQAMLNSGEAVMPLMGKKLMRTWISVPLGEGPEAEERWRALLADAAAYAVA